MLSLRAAPAAAALPAAVPSDCGVSMSCPTPPTTPLPVAGPGACGPAAGGATCSGTPAIASLGSQSSVNVGAGNPINVISGNKYQREDDLPALPGVLGLEIVRHYNSAYSTASTSTGILGRGWKLSYETDLYLIGNTLQVMQADGTRIIFSRDPVDRSLCSTANPANGRMQIVKRSRGEDFTWTWTDGRVLNFNSNGKLVQIVAPTGEFVSLQRDTKGLLVQVTDPQGRQLRLQYLDRAATGDNRFGGVASIVSPAGVFSYRYGSVLPAGSTVAAASVVANLAGVTFPDNSGRIYHHEDARRPTFLTGISLVSAVSPAISAAVSPSVKSTIAAPPQRIATYLYDLNGRAVLTVRGMPARLQTGADGKPLRPARLVEGTGIGQVVLDFAMPGQTQLINSLGQTTLYRHAIVGGEFRLLEVRGAGCFQCGDMNMRYGYDKLGRLVDSTQLTTDDAPLATLHTDLDQLGRAVRTTRKVYMRGKAGSPQLQARYAYADNMPVPNLIARPSVVPGKELLTQITYGTQANHRLLPVSITETGFMPALDGATEAQPISRTLRYGHDFHGHRIEVDGPMPNAPDQPGPNNSDITRYEHDPATGLLTKTVAPGGIVTEILGRDAALRATRIRTSDGSLTQTTTLQHNWRGQPTQITVVAAFLRDGAPAADGQLVRTLTYGYDAQGAISYITLPGNRTSRFVRDGAGRITQRILPDGSRIDIELDTEDRTRATTSVTTINATGNTTGVESVTAPIRSTRYRYDANNRITDIADRLGPREHLEYSDAGQIAALTNALGTSTRLTHDENGLLIAQTQAYNTPDAARISMAYDSHRMATAITDANGVTTRRQYDDFGRKLVEASPDRGVTLYHYDLAGHVVARIDETRVTLRYRYDHADRLVSMGVDRSPDLVTNTYQGMRLIDSITVAENDPKQVIERVRYRTNALGQMTMETRWMTKVDAPSAAPGINQPGLSFVTAYTYDGAGRPTTITLPDQHRISYRYGEQPGSGSAAGASGVLREILFDDQILVTDIKQSAVGGLTGYTTGSGIRQQIEFDQRGQLISLRAVTEARRPNLAVAGSWSQVEAWFKRRPVTSGSVIYGQTNRYDAAGRLIDLRRQPGTSTPRWTPPVHTELYEYDRLDRLTNADADGIATQFRYDKGGNRIAETGPQTARRYHYGPGANRMIALTQDGLPKTPEGADAMQKIQAPSPAGKTGQQLQSAWFYHPTGVPLAQWNSGKSNLRTDARTMPDASRRIVYNSARRPIAVHDGANRLMARYFYNGQGERVAKSVYASTSTAPGVAAEKSPLTPIADLSSNATTSPVPVQTAYSLYRDQRLSAETDADGHITAHYIYLDGKPIAKIDMSFDKGAGQGLHHALAVVTKWLSMSANDAADTIGSIHAIHTDHLGTPQAVTDDQQRIVWQAKTSAFGTTTVTHAAVVPATGKPYVMNLRLPGQVFDSETGLYQNYMRDYDPQLGRYTTPDPMGLAGGMNPYAYVNSNPLTKTDPLGLYEEDVHYYMTYFLALTAGLPEKQAWVIAMADRYIDDNSFTEPFGSTLMNSEARKDYHFTQSGYDPRPKSTEFAGGTDSTGEPTIVYSSAYMARRFINPVNPQLTRLSGYALSAPTICGKAQLYGEYLHAFQDTFAHRDAENIPYSYVGGHVAGFHFPDHTYNYNEWIYNEARTLEMEKEVFTKFKADFNKKATDLFSNKDITIADLNVTLNNFNRDKTDETPNLINSTKVKILQDKLFELGLPRMAEYNKPTAEKCRTANLKDLQGKPLDKTLYPNAILETKNAFFNLGKKCV